MSKVDYENKVLSNIKQTVLRPRNYAKSDVEKHQRQEEMPKEHKIIKLCFDLIMTTHKI